MPFPKSERVFYEHNPLEEVVCQLRFPPILRIDTEPPVAFQERVRRIFPLYQKSISPGQLALNLPPEIMQALVGGTGSTHEFSSPDQVWKLSLTRDFIALTTKSYKEWAHFKSMLQEPLGALIELYEPAFFVRVGLRYRDRINREILGVGGVSWHELLRPEALGELADGAIGPYVEHILRELVVRLSENAGQVRIVHGIERQAEKQTYVIDSDFYTEAQTDRKAVSDVLDAFNRRAGNLFRWYITARLHTAMDPRSPKSR